MIEFLFLDLDDTIFDFLKAEEVAVAKAFRSVGVEPAPETIARYSYINKQHWKMLERGEITRDELKVQRFAVLFEELGVDADPQTCAANYVGFLSQGHYFLPGAEEAVARLAKKYRLFLASNGNSVVQAGRLTSANLYRYFEKVFVSEDVGADKPSKAFFDRCFSQIPDFDVTRAMMVGDSLTSDILGGKNAGMQTCWVNPKHRPASSNVDHEIESLSQLEALIDTLT